MAVRQNRGIERRLNPPGVAVQWVKFQYGPPMLEAMHVGLDRVNEGTILVNGQDGQWHDGVRLMFQEPRLPPWRRVTRNVEVGLIHTRDKQSRRLGADAALTPAGLAGRGDHWPAVLSGGQKQRVALAHALVSHPRLLLLAH